MDQGDAGQESYATSISEVLPRLQSV